MGFIPLPMALALRRCVWWSLCVCCGAVDAGCPRTPRPLLKMLAMVPPQRVHGAISLSVIDSRQAYCAILIRGPCVLMILTSISAYWSRVSKPLIPRSTDLTVACAYVRVRASVSVCRAPETQETEFSFSNMTGESLTRLPGEIAGHPFELYGALVSHHAALM